MGSIISPETHKSSLFPCYHAIRDSVLNREYENATGVESLAYKALKPVRYLFGGLSAKQTEAGITIEQSFNYNDSKTVEMFKTALAVIFLIPSLLFGGILYLAARVFSDAYEHSRQIEKELHSPAAFKAVDYKALGIEKVFSDESAPGFDEVREANISEDETKEHKALKKVTRLLQDKKIAFWFDRETALGAYKRKGRLEATKIDLGILKEDHQNVRRLLSGLDREKYVIEDWSSYKKPQSLLRLHIKETNSYITFYHYEITAGEISYQPSHSNQVMGEKRLEKEEKLAKARPLAAFFPLKPATVEGISGYLPQDSTGFLQAQYGENLTLPKD